MANIFKKIFDPRNNSAECIYGPPEMLEGRNRRKSMPDKKDTFDAEKNEAIDIYGPPEMLGALDCNEDEPEESGDDQ